MVGFQGIYNREACDMQITIVFRGMKRAVFKFELHLGFVFSKQLVHFKGGLFWFRTLIMNSEVHAGVSGCLHEGEN